MKLRSAHATGGVLEIKLGMCRASTRENGMGYRIDNSWLTKLWLTKLWANEEGQDVAEYSVMLAVILVIVVGTIRLIGSNAGNIFSQVGSSIQ
jgi:Flp pilus assembly pilin Flp